MHREVKNQGRPVCMLPAEAEQGGTLPSCFNSHTANRCSFNGLFNATFFCLLFSFVDYVPVKGEVIWYLSLTAWLVSLSIMLSSSIHAVAKGISSFFLSGWGGVEGWGENADNCN